MDEGYTFAHLPPGGGFLHNTSTSLPSPAPSTASNQAAARLPHPRSKPLVRGSRKEDYARNYVSERLMHISRRYVKKHGIPDPADEVTGYENMDQVCKDLEQVVDVLWFSGTPSLQIPYLLNVAVAFNTYLPSFPPSPQPTFAFLKKMDHCFSSLVLGRDIKSGEPLSGLRGTGGALTSTDMVRCKSIVDESRMLVAMVMSDEPDVETFTDADRDDNGNPQSLSRRTVSVSLSTGFVQTPIPDSSGVDSDRIKSEDVIEFEDESDPSDEEIPNDAASKRKPDDTDLEDGAHDDPKRIKVEDDQEPGPKFSDAGPWNRSPGPIINGPGPSRPDNKFHWMVDDDDDDDDDSNDETTTNAAATGIAAPAPPVVEFAPDTEQDVNEPVEVVDEEEEELQLNVGKVYEKTLIQLGKSLGESIIDN
ncbi:hypothetical protein F5Y04DRAFT_215677 [Hypomontagnella monticulosa]|nr:hypothetical protein F5Y04DRAFT_215677 [Hypomontagnella monticulosa]